MSPAPDTAVPPSIRLHILVNLPEEWVDFGLQEAVEIPTGLLEQLSLERSELGNPMFEPLMRNALTAQFAAASRSLATSVAAILVQRSDVDHPLTHLEYIEHQQALADERERRHDSSEERDAAVAEARRIAGAPDA